jgi:hypothetical protein
MKYERSQWRHANIPYSFDLRGIIYPSFVRLGPTGLNYRVWLPPHGAPRSRAPFGDHLVLQSAVAEVWCMVPNA